MYVKPYIVRLMSVMNVINGNQYQTELLTWDNFCSFGLELWRGPSTKKAARHEAEQQQRPKAP